MSKKKTPLLQIHFNKTAWKGSNKDLRSLKKEFETKHYVRLPGFLDKDLFENIQASLKTARFYQRIHRGEENYVIATESCMRKNKTHALLQFLMNDQKLFSLIREITGCGTIGCFNGRTFRLTAKEGHYDNWHDDLKLNRMLAISINLSKEKYEGGIFQLRKTGGEGLLASIHNTGPGDAFLFRVARGLEHQVLPVTGDAVRTTYAGWFRSKPALLTSLKKSAKLMKVK